MNQHGGADLDGADDLVPGSSGTRVADVARLIAVLALLMVVALVLMAASHAIEPQCGGG